MSREFNIGKMKVGSLISCLYLLMCNVTISKQVFAIPAMIGGLFAKVVKHVLRLSMKPC